MNAETARRRRELELTINQQLEDIANSLITSQREREVAEAETRFNRQIQSLRKQLNEEKNLTKSAREDLNSVIILLEQRKNAEISVSIPSGSINSTPASCIIAEASDVSIPSGSINRLIHLYQS